MELIKHKTRGYGHAKKTIEPDGRISYSVQFFDRYGDKLHFTEISFTKGILERMEP